MWDLPTKRGTLIRKKGQDSEHILAPAGKIPPEQKRGKTKKRQRGRKKETYPKRSSQKKKKGSLWAAVLKKNGKRGEAGREKKKSRKKTNGGGHKEGREAAQLILCSVHGIRGNQQHGAVGGWGKREQEKAQEKLGRKSKDTGASKKMTCQGGGVQAKKKSIKHK